MKGYKFQLDHVVIVVPSLVWAIEQFQALGFKVDLGGDNGPTHNALISFEDGSYVELVCVRSALMKNVFRFLCRTRCIYLVKPFISDLTFRFACLLGGSSGIQDWCVKHESLAQVREKFGFSRTSRIEKLTRIKPDLEIVEWRLLAPIERRLPFLIEDITDSALRIPSASAHKHANGCVGISGLLLNTAIYSSIKHELKELSVHAWPSTNQTRLPQIKFDAQQECLIAIEFFDAASNLLVLEMTNTERPKLRRKG